MKSCYLTAGIRFSPLMRLLRENQVSFRPKYLARMAFLLQSGLWSSFFTKIEKVRFGETLRHTPEPVNPVFIIGHWRSGSTFLHQIMTCDPQFTAPTLFQTAQPDNFITSYPYYRPVFLAMVEKSRPMDNVRLGMDEPQEDEYALYRLTGFSPLTRLIFPREKRYFLHDVGSYLPPDSQSAEWEQQIIRFFQKITFHTGKRIVSKNPFHSLRIETLSRLFPEARFIHIVRDPMRSIPSTINMWNIVQRQNCLNGNACRPTTGEVCDGLNYLLDQVDIQSKKLPGNRFREIRFEDLEQDPLNTIQSMYQDLEIPYTASFETNLKKFLSEVSSYRKNTFNLTDTEKQEINEKMDKMMSRYHYSPYI
ncbi:MAG TPA: sulfotransferase [Bacteroidales bacterium]|nr:sulfotransferase [Bacteroidales bacterium]HPS73317.1 sulfotransferase [Bacteroidales bacterium]